LDESFARVASIAVAAWVSGLACAVVSGWHARRVARHRSPGVDALFEQVRAEAGGFGRAELRELAREAERALSLATLLPRSLTRVALTTGTALGVLVLAVGGAAPTLQVAGALLAFAGGAVGTMVSVFFGQRAKSLAATARAEWKRHLREVEHRLETQNSAPGGP
jgi:hypothetical protein